MLTAGMENNLKEGDLILYKDFTEDYWRIGIYKGYDENSKNKCKHRIIVGIQSDDEGNPDTEKLMDIPYRYAIKFNIKNLDMK